MTGWATRSARTTRWVVCRSSTTRPDSAARRTQVVSLMTTDENVIVLGGQDWEEIVAAARQGEAGERIVVNMGPQHPSTHGGVLRLILEIEGETVTQARCGIGYLHTGIEKNLEYRTWTQGVTFVTRMDYLSPFFQRNGLLLGCGTAA